MHQGRLIGHKIVKFFFESRRGTWFDNNQSICNLSKGLEMSVKLRAGRC